MKKIFITLFEPHAYEPMHWSARDVWNHHQMLELVLLDLFNLNITLISMASTAHGGPIMIDGKEVSKYKQLQLLPCSSWCNR